MSRASRDLDALLDDHDRLEAELARLAPLADLQRLYDGEFSFTISAFWDGGFTAFLGVPMGDLGELLQQNGEEFPTIAEAANYLIREAIRRHPESSFARSRQP